jgi:hypothetical protein
MGELSAGNAPECALDRNAAALHPWLWLNPRAQALQSLPVAFSRL